MGVAHDFPESLFKPLFCKAQKQKFWLLEQLYVVGAQFLCVALFLDARKLCVRLDLFRGVEN
jgi:hypothetical protein